MWSGVCLLEPGSVIWSALQLPGLYVNMFVPFLRVSTAPFVPAVDKDRLNVCLFSVERLSFFGRM